MAKYTLIDTTNGMVVSRHRSLKAAARADLALDRAIKRRYGSRSYIETIITRDGEQLDEKEYDKLCEYLSVRESC